MTTNSATIVEFKTANVLKATVTAGGVFSGTGLKASGQTASTIASFDAFQNVVSLTTANGYPTLTELKSLVGVSATAIQTQLNAKQASNVNLTSLSGLTYSTSAFVKMTAAGTFTLDTSGGGGTITLNPIGTDATANANGATITGSVLNLEPANASFGGVITTGSQTFAGAKTFQSGPSAPTAPASSNSTLLATTAYVDRQVNTGGIYNILISSFPGNTITTQDTGTSGGSGSYSQNGRNVMINNGATAIIIAATVSATPNDFIASYTKIGTADITFTFSGTGFVFKTPNGAVLSGDPGSTALLTKNGSTVYLLINNIV